MDAITERNPYWHLNVRTQHDLLMHDYGHLGIAPERAEKIVRQLIGEAVKYRIKSEENNGRNR